MKVLCKINKDDRFTIGKQYDVEYYSYDTNDHNKREYYIISDKGKITSVSNKFFITLDEFREEQLKKVLNIE